MTFQLSDLKTSQRKYCYQESLRDSGNITMEDSFLSFLGMRKGLRHWSITPVDLDTGEAAEKMADYFDYAAPGNPPHSVHLNRNEKDFTEVRYVEFNEDLNTSEVNDWLKSQLMGSPELVDVTDLTDCTIDSRVIDDTPAILDAFEEERYHVDWYTKAMLSLDIKEAYTGLLEDTYLDQYWGAVSYLRRLLAQQTADEVTSASSVEDEYRTPAVETPSVRLDYTDPFFYREIGATLLGGTNATSEDVTQFWKQMFFTSPRTADGVNMAGFIARVAEKSGLTDAQLNEVPAPVTYATKATVQTLAESPDWLHATHLSWVSGAEDFTVDDEQYVRVKVTGNGDCTGTVYKVNDVPDDANPTAFTLVAATSQHARDNPNVPEPVDEVGSTLDALGLDSSTTVFFFPDYDTAAAASCDPAAAMPGAAGRRQLSEISESKGNDEDLEWSTLEKPVMVTRQMKGSRRRRRSPPPPPPFNANAWAPTFAGSAIKKPGSWTVTSGSAIPGTPASIAFANCGDNPNVLCSAVLTVTFTDESDPPWDQVSGYLGCDLEVAAGVSMMGGRWFQRTTNSYYAIDGSGKSRKVSTPTKCKQGLEETLSVSLTGKRQPPKWAGSLKNSIEISQTGSLALTHGHCEMAHNGHSLDSARTDANFIRITGAYSQKYSLAVCREFGVGGAAAEVYLEGGVWVRQT
jgi:hypothetical protein